MKRAVLSEQMTVTQPSVSTLGSLRISAFRLTMRCKPSARAIVTTAGNPSGIAAIESGRQFIGIELNPQFAKAARQRLIVSASQQKSSNLMNSEKRQAA